MMYSELRVISKRIGIKLKKQSQILVTAESCTGGGISTIVTETAGSSAWFDRTFVTYSNAAKMDMLGVNAETLDTFGAVSEETVQEMAKGALAFSLGTCSIAVSGIAGPDGGTEEKPVGTVCFAWAMDGEIVKCETVVFNGNREEVRTQACFHALDRLEDILDEHA